MHLDGAKPPGCLAPLKRGDEGYIVADPPIGVSVHKVPAASVARGFPSQGCWHTKMFC